MRRDRDGDRDDEREEFGRAEDFEDFKQRKRTGSIMEARQYVRHVADKMHERVLSGRAGRAMRNSYIHEALKSYLYELEAATDKDTRDGQWYWYEVELGAVTFEVPGELQDHMDAWPVVGDPPEPRTVTLYGLNDIFEFEAPVEQVFEVTVDERHREAQTYREATTKHLPKRISMNAYRAANELAADLNLDVEMEEAGEKEAGLDYSDLLDE